MSDSSATHQSSQASDATAGDGWREAPVMIAIMGRIYRDVFAVHTKLGLSDEWTITHIPSGYSMARATGTFETAAEAENAAEIIFGCHDDWRGITPKTPREVFLEIGDKIRAALKARTPAVKPENGDGR